MIGNDDFVIPQLSEDELILIDKMYTLRELYWPHYTWLAQTNYLKILERKKNNLKNNLVDLDLFKGQLSSLFNKINGSFYHLQRIKENEKLIIDLGTEVARKRKSKIPARTWGSFGTSYEPIGYDYEAMLVTLRSSLDILAIIFSSIIGFKSDNIMKLINEMNQIDKVSGFGAQIKQFLDSQPFLQLINEFKNDNGTKSRRNYAVHAGSLSTGTINIQFVHDNSKIGVIKSKAMPIKVNNRPLSKEQDLDDFCTTIFYKTCDILLSGIGIIIEEKLPVGEQKSIFELKRIKKQQRV